MRFLLRPSTHAYRGLLDSELRSLLVSSKEFEPYRTTELEVMKTGVPSIAKEEPPIITQEKTFYYLSSKIPLRNITGEIIGIVGISTDITFLKEIQYALQVALEIEKEANKEKIESFINVAHDLKDLLSKEVFYA